MTVLEITVSWIIGLRLLSSNDKLAPFRTALRQRVMVCRQTAPGLCLKVLLAMPLCLGAQTSWAQSQPDASSLLGQHKPTVKAFHESDSQIQVAQNIRQPIVAGGATVLVKGVLIKGAHVFSESELLDVLGQTQGISLDMAGLQALANRITQHYHQAGYLFALAYFPPQSVTSGTVVIEVMEGHYGHISTSGEVDIAESAKPYLQALKSGDVIAQVPLTRAMLILADVPGIDIKPVLRPGAVLNTADMDVMVSEGRSWDGSFTLDNHNSRYTGDIHGRLAFGFNHALSFGDRLSLSWEDSLRRATDGNANTYAIDYALGLGSNGLRGKATISQSAYSLGHDFVGFTGSAKALSVGLSYPIIRSIQTNLIANFSYEHNDLSDYLNAISYSTQTTRVVSTGLRFDHRDAWLGGGQTTAHVSLDEGHISATSDGSGANKIRKLAVDVSREQSLFGPIGLRINGHGHTNKYALNDYHKTALGGAQGVRAYPSGEAVGPSGGYLQTEFNYSHGGYLPFAFYDFGIIGARTNNAGRTLSGYGIGLRTVQRAYEAAISVAWKGVGGIGQSDSQQRSPQVWSQIKSSF